ncbi:OmpW/AlkL family protein [Caldimonas brevitalea]|uniref:OmpW/AlkL family protein n=1 Tax=Caldimonas brevitalea TaxID=413882 RepID=UPI001EEE9513|nr:OmpW family outer membrane protein [Caldimonas brevitalea]
MLPAQATTNESVMHRRWQAGEDTSATAPTPATTLAQAGEGSPPASGLQIDKKRRWFARVGVSALKLNDKSENVEDVTGPVLRSSDHPVLRFLAPGVESFGTPEGATVDVKNSASLFGSVGKFLDDHWAIEGLVLAVPFKHDIYGKGTIERLGKVATVKQLPPTLILHRYFGEYNARFRPSLGIGLNYTYFFDAEATPALESYTGGPTKIKMKPSWGLGLFAGAQYALTERLHIKLTLGYVRVRTTATMTTTNTMLSGSSPVLHDYPYPVNQIPTDPTSRQAMDNLVGQVAAKRGGDLGTYERELKSELNPYVLLMSVGYSF